MRKLWKLPRTFRTQNAFVESKQALDIAILLEKGVPVVDKQADMTPFQRQVLVKEFERQEKYKADQMPDEAKENSGPRKVTGGTRNQRHNSANSKKEAIKNSQEDSEKFVNKSAINNE